MSFDGQVVRPPKELAEVAKDYVCVRVVNMKGVDLNVYTFDYDLTFAALLMNADGTVYHRYGGRDWRDASGRLSMTALVRVLRDGLADHAEYAKHPNPPAAKPKRTIEDIAPFAARLKKNPKMECIHCHMVNDAERELAQQEKRWGPDDVWMWPLPDQIGLKLDVDDPALVKEITAGTAAAKAGLKAGDRLVRVNGVRVRSEADVEAILDAGPASGLKLKVEFERGGAEKSCEIPLAKGWKVQTPLDYSWRPAMWQLRPNPGFGGKDLTAEEKGKLGLKPDDFAFRIGYIIDWGDHAEDGKNARKAGIQKNDVVIAAGGLSDFRTSQHFQTWFRFTQKPGTRIEFKLLRDGKPVTVTMDVIP